MQPSDVTKTEVPGAGQASSRVQARPGAAQTPPSELESLAGTVDPGVLGSEQQRIRIGALRMLLLSYVLIAAASFWTRGWGSGDMTFGYFAVINGLLVLALLLLARRQRYHDLVSAGIGVSTAAFGLTGCVVVGIGSASVVALPVLVYYYGMGDSALRRRIVLAFVIGGYAFLIILALVGILPHGGRIQWSLGTQANLEIGIAFVVLQILLATYWLARKTRQSTLLAMGALEQARRAIGKRDALLQEANANLDRAIEGGRLGRFSEREVGSWAMGQVLGRGAIGEVYEARHVETGQACAVKVLRPHLQTEPGHIKRFLREVRAVGTLNSPHVPRLIDAGEDPLGGPYLVMDLLKGEDLGTLLRRRARLQLAETDRLVDHLTSALAAAHAADIVHRDIKPQNVFRTDAAEPTWMILDFGVSRLVHESATLTGGAAIGTPAYMAPEQVIGADIDARADVFALGAVLYRAVTGRPAFSGPSELVTMLRVSRTQPVQPSKLVAAPRSVDSFFALALAKVSERRLPSAEAFRDAWHAARAGALDPRLTSEAESILEAHPWGTDSEQDEATQLAEG